LFDLENDPRELNNLYGAPEYHEVILELKHRIEQWQELR
jgi:hypothetical protein